MQFSLLHERTWLGFDSHKNRYTFAFTKILSGSILKTSTLNKPLQKACQGAGPPHFCYKSPRAGHVLSLKEHFKQKSQTFLILFPENSDFTKAWLSFLPPWWSSKTCRFISLIEDKVAAYYFFLFSNKEEFLIWSFATINQLEKTFIPTPTFGIFPPAERRLPTRWINSISAREWRLQSKPGDCQLPSL